MAQVEGRLELTDLEQLLHSSGQTAFLFPLTYNFPNKLTFRQPKNFQENVYTEKKMLVNNTAPLSV